MENIRSLCVYCGSSDRGPASHAEAARALGRLMAERGIRLVYGGGRIGVMGILADAVLAGGGEVVGVIPRFLDDVEVGHVDVSRLEVVESMHERKALMAELSDAFVVLPGGLGTMDETFEILTWRQLGLHDKPIVIVNQDGYWTPARDLIDHIIASNYARPNCADLAHWVDSVDEILPALAGEPAATIDVATEKL